METEKIYNNIWELLEEHECGDWQEFREFVHYATDDIADIGYIGGSDSSEYFSMEDLEEMNGIFFLTEDGISDTLYFPIKFDDFTDIIERMGIFKNI